MFQASIKIEHNLFEISVLISDLQAEVVKKQLISET